MIVGSFDNKYIERKNKGNEILKTEQCLKNIRTYLRDMINDFKNFGK